MKLENHTILITGGSSGIGLALAEKLSKKNNVIICGRCQDRLDQATKLLPQVHAFQCDVALPKDRQRLSDYMKTNHPTFSMLVNNAAIVHKGDFVRDEQIVMKAESEIATNLLAPIALTKAFLSEKFPALAVINITTGLIYAPRAVYPIYNATKAALHSFTQVLRHQLEHSNVKVIEVLMPVVNTPWHNGDAPRIAISAEQAVDEMVVAIERRQTEIKVGKVKALSLIARLSPSLAFRMINRLR